jgi:uncharacterized phiE125 gp8 family phage protein
MKYGVTLVTAPASEPVSIAEAAAQVRVPIEGGAYDAELLRLIKAARRIFELRTGRQLNNATYDFKIDRFPCDRHIKLPKSPFYTITESVTYPGLGITYYDADGQLQTLSTDIYKPVTSREPGEIHLKFGQTWPVAYAEAESVTVRFVAGYGALATAVPEDIKSTLLLMIDDWFEHRMGEGEVGPAVASLLTSFSTGDEFVEYGERPYAYAV